MNAEESVNLNVSAVKWIDFGGNDADEEILLRAAHRMGDRAFARVERTSHDGFRVGLTPKHSIANTEVLAGDFCNLVIDERLRARIRTETEPVRRLIIAQAFSGFNVIAPQLDNASSDEDPLRIGEPDV